MVVRILLIALAAGAGAAAAEEEPIFRLQISPYTEHYKRRAEHQHVWLVGLELEREGTIHGIAFFKNSFGQPSLYAYPWGGIHRNLFNIEPLFFKWSIGILYGYKNPYQDKVPANYRGFSPAIIPAIGWTFRAGFSTHVNFLGTSGLMFQISKDL